jgi:hypothetical protein
MSILRRRNRTCPSSPDGQHSYEEVPNSDTLGVSGGCYVHGYRMRCQCGSEFAGTYEVEEYR